MEGDPRRFGRADTIAEQWRIVGRLIDGPRDHPALYDKGTWGPDEAEALAADLGGWKVPLED